MAAGLLAALSLFPAAQDAHARVPSSKPAAAKPAVIKLAAATLAPPLFRPDYCAGLTSWQAVQQPAGTTRMTTTAAPGLASDPFRPQERVMRAELRAGDRTDTGGYVAPRAEVYARLMKPTTSPAALWPDPVGSERWYAFSLYVPADFPTATDTKWLTLTQWKGQYGGSPPIALEIKRSNLRVGGVNGPLLPLAGDLGPLVKGQWTRLVVGLKHSPDPATGWIEVYRDGVQKIARTSVATMDAYGGSADPTYLKQGIYRSSAWSVTQVLYFSPVSIYAGPTGVSPAQLP